MRIVSCRYRPRQAVLDLSFANGDRFQIPAETLLMETELHSGQASPRLPVGMVGFYLSPRAPEWDRLRIGETRDVLEVPIGNRWIEIPWDRLRCVADPDYRAHMQQEALKAAQRLGHRLRRLRRDGGFTQRVLANATGLSPTTISRVEKGLERLTYENLIRLLAALGKEVEDLADGGAPARKAK